MKVINFRLAFRTAILTIVFSAAAHAEDKPVPQKELHAKIDYCKTCHGVAGQGFRGSVPMPRLAGQQPEYLQNQLQAFIERRRSNPVMNNVAHVLSPAMMAGLAAHFKELNPKPLDGGPNNLVDPGKTIYEDGVPSAGVPACVSCHGLTAKGTEAFPRLAGQLHDYLFRKLVNWSKERGQDKAKPDSSAIMEPIAHNLTEVQVRTVAAYLSHLE